jgi:hypothetical protein
MSLLLYFFIYYALIIAAPAATTGYLKPLVIVFNITPQIFGYPFRAFITNNKATSFSGKIICNTANLLTLKITTPN